MDLTLSRSDVDRRSLAIARFFSAILFGFAAIIALPMALVLAVALWAGDWRPLPIVAGASPVAGGLFWLGRLLWIGRPIPRWFIAAFCYGIVLVPVAGLLWTGSWMGALTLLGLSLPMLAQMDFG